MVIEFKLNGLLPRLAVGLAAIGASVGLAAAVMSNFIVYTLSDDRAVTGRPVIQTAQTYFPASTRLNARLAEVDLMGPSRDLSRASEEINRAIALSPHDYTLRLVLASIKEAQGDQSAAEASLETALALAPNYADVRWRLANLEIRRGNVPKALDNLSQAVGARPALLPSALDLVWRVSGGQSADLDPLAPVARPEARIQLAKFLFQRSRFAEAEQVFKQVDRPTRIGSNVTAELLNAMIAAGRIGAARQLWADTVGDVTNVGGGPSQDTGIVWNGGFEADRAPVASQFDWAIATSDYAQISIDPTVAHSGTRSLRLFFTGKETTRLNGEVKQLVGLKPGHRYRLEFWVKTRGLEATEGPRLTLACNQSAAFDAWSATSAPVPAGTNDWSKLALDFVAPLPRRESAAPSRANTEPNVPLTLGIVRIPKFNYDDPMNGIVWFDDVSIVEAGGG
ncbi:MAG TPA: tetratricopeptide repeat protein [Blastocatellia bacterium]|nr:tetratricopeptide repeat protein [Blastocatellia bacterium]